MPYALPLSPAEPDDGSSTSDGAWTLNVAEEKSFVIPVAVIVYPPVGTLATSKLPVNIPPNDGFAGSAEIEQEGGIIVLTGGPDSVQGPISLIENPDP